MKAELSGRVEIPDDVNVGDELKLTVTVRCVSIVEGWNDLTTYGSKPVPMWMPGLREATVRVRP